MSKQNENRNPAHERALSFDDMKPGVKFVAYNGMTNTMEVLTVIAAPEMIEFGAFGETWVVTTHNRSDKEFIPRLVDLGVIPNDDGEWNPALYSVGYADIGDIIYERTRRQQQNESGGNPSAHAPAA